MTIIIKNEKQETHVSYDEFEQIIFRQADLPIGTTIRVLVDGKAIPELNYTVQFINAHFHITIQDKGIKKEINPNA